MFSSVGSYNGSSGPQIEIGVGRCYSSTIDNTCGGGTGLSALFLFDEVTSDGSHFTCYQHGTTSLGSSDLMTADVNGNTGTWYGYIDGNGPYESESLPANIFIAEWAEDRNASGTCSNFTASGSFATWQRYYYSGNTWTTVSSANGSAVCWQLGGLGSNGNFSVSR